LKKFDNQLYIINKYKKVNFNIRNLLLSYYFSLKKQYKIALCNNFIGKWDKFFNNLNVKIYNISSIINFPLLFINYNNSFSFS
jgi:hypothetical protein